LIFLDIIVYMFTKSLAVEMRSRRYTRVLRVLIYINFNEGRELRRAIRNVRKTLPDIFNVFALFFISLLMFSFLGWQMFKEKKLEKKRGMNFFF
jgi:two pore calcium channel protein 3